MASISKELKQQTVAIRGVIQSRQSVPEIRANGASSSSNSFSSGNSSVVVKKKDEKKSCIPSIPIPKKQNIQNIYIPKQNDNDDKKHDFTSLSSRPDSAFDLRYYKNAYEKEKEKCMLLEEELLKGSKQTYETQLLRDELQYYMSEYKKEHEKCENLLEDKLYSRLYVDEKKEETNHFSNIANIDDELLKISFVLIDNGCIIQDYDKIDKNNPEKTYCRYVMNIMKNFIGKHKVVTIYPVLMNNMFTSNNYHDILTIYTITKENVYKSVFHYNTIGNTLDDNHIHLQKFNHSLSKVTQNMLKSYTKKSSIYKNLMHCCNGESYGSESMEILYKNEINRFEDILNSISES